MFGFLSPLVNTKDYRAVYSRCCQHQRLQTGLLSLPFLSYESIFLYLYWLDATGHDAAMLPAQTCCRLRKLPDVEGLADAEIGAFCSALAMVLAQTKLDDDIRDQSSLPGRIIKGILHKQFGQGQKYFRNLAPDFAETIAATIEAHLVLEHNQCVMPIQEYCKPTAEAFGYIFSLLARLPYLSGEENTLRRIGEQIGAALIAFDCVADWRRDQERGDFNPLAEHDIEPALAFSVQSLQQARSLCEQRFGHDSGTVKLLQGVEQSLTFKPDGPNCLAEVSKPAGIGALLGG